MSIKKISCLVLLVWFYGITQAQYNYTFLETYPEFNAQYADHLLFRVESNNFLKNNEYFGSNVEGYTLLGYDIEPSFLYYAGSAIRLKAGVHLKKYSGNNVSMEVLPVLSLHAKLSPSFELIMGALKGSIHHQMIEPLFDSERLYSRPVENGLQFLINTKSLKVDTWIDWEQFIVKGDTIPEKFTFGTSAEVTLINKHDNWALLLPIQIIATHVGGQISDFSEPMKSKANVCVGLSAQKSLGGFVQKLSFSNYFMVYKSLTKKDIQPFYTGNAFYSIVSAESNHFQAMLGYFSGNDFAAPRGSFLFQSVSNYIDDYYAPNRQLSTVKLSYVKKIGKAFAFSALAETYYNLKIGNLEYAYGVNMVFTPNFTIVKVPSY